MPTYYVVTTYAVVAITTEHNVLFVQNKPLVIGSTANSLTAVFTNPIRLLHQ